MVIPGRVDRCVKRVILGRVDRCVWRVILGRVDRCYCVRRWSASSSLRSKASPSPSPASGYVFGVEGDSG